MDINTLYLREAVQDDCDLLFNWANDDTVRQNSFNTEKIEYTTHCEWYNNILQDVNCKQYILMFKTNEDTLLEVGQIRLNIDNNKANIDYSIALDYRTMGFGNKLIDLICKKVQDELPEIKVLAANVKPNNIASKKIFIDNGFYEKCSVFELNISHNVKKEGSQELLHYPVGGYSS